MSFVGGSVVGRLSASARRACLRAIRATIRHAPHQSSGKPSAVFAHGVPAVCRPTGVSGAINVAPLAYQGRLTPRQGHLLEWALRHHVLLQSLGRPNTAASRGGVFLLAAVSKGWTHYAPLAASTSTSFIHNGNFLRILYIVAFALFIYGLSGLTGPRTAVRGNRIAAVGMAIAVIATLLQPGEGNWGLIVLGIALGTLVGVPAARRVKMTAMPQMVALFNGVGGGAVFLIAWAEFRNSDGFVGKPLYVAVFSLFAAIVGSVSFWGSNIAFGKLQGLLPGRPITLGRAQQIVNGLLLAGAVLLAVLVANGSHSQLEFVGMLLCAAVLGNFVVLPIGGADMPVVISMLNAFTGLSAAATGVALNNPALIVAGMIVGASGSILTNLMAVAMNRSIPAIIAGGFGGGGQVEGASGAGEHEGTVRSVSAADVAIQLAYARLVVIVPGYGMAVAQAQHTVRELAKALEARGVEVLYAIHPVAGRMPGHMNVLLAEADVPYDQLKEMDDINPEFSRTDVALVIGANDVTNPAAKTNPGSPIFGMPILNVEEAQSVVVIKRSMNPGFAGIENELYYKPNTSMLFGDAKSAVASITAELADV